MAAGGFVLYEAIKGMNTGNPVAPGTTTNTEPINTNVANQSATTTPQGNNTTTTTTVIPTNPGVTAQQLQQQINFLSDQQGSPDQWSYAFGTKTGTWFTPDLMDKSFGVPGTPTRDRTMQASEFISIIKANGGTGLAGLRGLNGGTVARANWWESQFKFVQ